MTDRPRRTGLPRDSRARDRLREAQQLEAQALAGVCRAEEGLRQACAKRDAAAATANLVVDQAQQAVEAAQAALVCVSGVERAAALLAVQVSSLRKVVNSRSRQDAGE